MLVLLIGMIADKIKALFYKDTKLILLSNLSFQVEDKHSNGYTAIRNNVDKHSCPNRSYVN